MTLGSLFDGIGGFPLAAIRNGITPLWASEIEAPLMSITKRHFPDMVHLGNIQKVDGAKIEPVDIITFGSPCQDLSSAGRRAGLDGARSFIFFDAIRVIKQMRRRTNGKFTARIIWENVPGAFSSNGGEDFRVVLAEIASVAGGAISIPRPPARDGDTFWKSAGSVVGDGWSLAWRVLDAQYWGVPQRRRRIFLVADFRGECARQILFKPESLSGDITESGAARKGASRDFKNGVEAAGRKAIPINTQIATRHKALGEGTGLGVGHDGDPAYTLQENHSHAVCLILNDQGGSRINIEKNNVSPCLRSETHGHPPIVLENHPNDSRIKIKKDGVVQTLSSRMGTGGGNVPLIFEPGIASRDGGHVWQNDVAPSLRATLGDNLPAVCLPAYCIQGNTIGRAENAGVNGKGVNEDVSFTLNTIDRHAVAFCRQGFGHFVEDDVASTMQSRDYKDFGDIACNGFAVRRLTPTECERLQGFPDGWTALTVDGERIPDSVRYKALGNSVALPCVEYIMASIREAG